MVSPFLGDPSKSEPRVYLSGEGEFLLLNKMKVTGRYQFCFHSQKKVLFCSECSASNKKVSCIEDEVLIFRGEMWEAIVLWEGEHSFRLGSVKGGSVTGLKSASHLF